MKKIQLIIALCCSAIVGPAAAADPYSWSGWYVGGNAGGSWGSHDADIDIPSIARVFAGMSQQGTVGGVHGGYNIQLGAWVLGLESAYDRTSIKGRSMVSAPMIFPGAEIHSSGETNWLASLSGRLGYASARTLYFAKAGAARMDFDYRGFTSIGGTVVGGASQSGARTGWTVGTGLEQALFQAWSARLEYDYFDFGDRTYLFAGVTPVTLSPSYHVLRAGLTYKFGG